MMKLSLFTSTLVLITCLSASAQWEQSNGPTGGYITHIIEDHAGVLFASTGWGGIVRSGDGGDSWASAEQGLTWPAGSLAANEFAVFAASNGVARSVNSGQTWEEANNGIDNTDVGSLAVNAQGHVYAGVTDGTNGEAGIYISEDNGDSWTFKPLYAPTYMESIEVAVNADNHIFVGGPGIVLRSIDNGDSWEDISPVYGFYYTKDIVFDTAGTVYMGATYDGGLFRSGDNGDAWTMVVPDEIFSINVNAENEVFAATPGGIYMSENGIDWLQPDNSPHGVSCLYVTGNDTLYAGCYGIYRSFNDGYSWEKSSNGLVSSIVWSMDASQTGTIFAVTDSLWRSQDSGETWENVSAGYFNTTIETKVVAGANGAHYVIANDGYEGRLFRSTDDGDTWQLLFANSSHFKDVKVNSQGDIFVATDYAGLYRSTDGGSNFSLTGLENESLNALEINSNGTILASTGSSPYYVYRSDDNGNSWSPSYTMFSWYGARVMSSDSTGYFYMATYDELFRSGDEGISWDNITGQLPSYSVSITAMESGRYDTLYIATRNDGIFKSGDYGNTWEPYGEGLPVYGWVNDLAANTSSGTLYAGYHGKGVWTRGYDDINVPAFYAARPTSGISIFPNPAHEAVTVKYDGFSVYDQTTVGIHDLHGRLLKEIQLTGTETSLRLEGISKGMYIVGLTGKSEGEKLVVE